MTSLFIMTSTRKLKCTTCVHDPSCLLHYLICILKCLLSHGTISTLNKDKFFIKVQTLSMINYVFDRTSEFIFYILVRVHNVS